MEQKNKNKNKKKNTRKKNKVDQERPDVGNDNEVLNADKE